MVVGAVEVEVDPDESVDGGGAGVELVDEVEVVAATVLVPVTDRPSAESRLAPSVPPPPFSWAHLRTGCQPPGVQRDSSRREDGRLGESDEDLGRPLV